MTTDFETDGFNPNDPSSGTGFLGTLASTYLVPGVEFPLRWVSRSLGSTVYDAYTFTNGTKLGVGEYRLVVWSLQPFGDRESTGDWNVDLTGTFSVVSNSSSS